MTQKDQKRFLDHRRVHNQFRTLCARARGCVHVFDFVMTRQNISNDGDKGVQICISPTFIEPSVYQGMHQCWMHVSDTDNCTDRGNTPVPLIWLLTGVLDGRKTKLA